jgi:hypothetical protein
MVVGVRVIVFLVLMLVVGMERAGRCVAHVVEGSAWPAWKIAAQGRGKSRTGFAHPPR